MAETFIQPGDVIEVTAPTGGVVSGLPVKIGSIVGIATVTAAQTEKFNLAVTGVWTLPKETAEPWSEGLRVYWNASTSKATSLSTNNVLIGIATTNAPNPSTTAPVRLNGAGVWP